MPEFTSTARPSPLPLAILVCLLAAAPCLASIDDAFGEPSLLVDLAPGQDDSSPGSYVTVGPRSLFIAGADLEGALADPNERRLWTTDGTPGGTFPLPVGDLAAATPYPVHLGQDGDEALVNLAGDDGTPSLWRTDGTVAGTVRLADGVHFGQPPVSLPGDRSVFPAIGEDGTPQPWVTDGTPAGTSSLVPLAAGSLESVSDYVLFGGEVYFRGEVGVSSAVWKTDGTVSGTTTAILSNDGVDWLGVPVPAGSALLVTGVQGTRVVVGRSDGTVGSTEVIADLAGTDAEIELLANLSDTPTGQTVWVVREAGATTLWAIDPSGAEALGTVSAVHVDEVERLGDAAYFFAARPGIGRELFRTDGTAAGTGPVVDLCPGACDGAPGESLTPFDGRLFLVGRSAPADGGEPLVTDGTGAGTGFLGDLCPGLCGSDASFDLGLDLGDAFVFLAAPTEDGPRQLWAAGLNPEGTLLLTDFAGGAQAVGRAGNRVVVTGDDGIVGSEPWVIPTTLIENPDPDVPPGPWLTGPGLGGFEVKVRIRTGGEETAGFVESACLPETLCLSGFLPGRSELFVRVIGPRPNGFLWPVLTKFTPSEVEVWIRQQATGQINRYLLPAAAPGVDELPGLFDRTGFLPVG